ncbi:MAG: hypothetical protein GXP25_02660 [Planctomycetes bacterium]|nr:hypothetical protein [Planctomycetota bacterium]
MPEFVGYISLIVLFICVLGPLFRVIPLPLQTILVLGTILNLLVGGVALALNGAGLAAILSMPTQVHGNIILLPIMALLSGFLMAGALEHSGAFDALRLIVAKAQRTPLGLAGTVVLIVQIPTVFAMPCGRIQAAALLPVVMGLGPEGIGLLRVRQMVVLVGALAVNCAASCGPSQIGGIGQIGEGIIGQLRFLQMPQEFGIMIGTAFTALFLCYFTTQLDLDENIRLRDRDHAEEKRELQLTAPLSGYASLLIFLVCLTGSVFGLFGKTPITTVLIAGTVLIMILSGTGIQAVVSGIVLHPVTALIAGFLMAGSLSVTGGFEVLGTLVRAMGQHTFFGLAGMAVLFIQLETIVPMPCGRILAAALLPVVFALGPKTISGSMAIGLFNETQITVLLAAFIVNAAASCGPSPIGGVGTIAEGIIRSEIGYLRSAQSFGIMMLMSPMAAVSMRFLQLEKDPMSGSNLLTIGVLMGGLFAVSCLVLRLMRPSGKLVKGKKMATILAFLIGGAFSGAVIAFAMDFRTPGELLQGALGGVLSAVLLLLT